MSRWMPTAPALAAGLLLVGCGAQPGKSTVSWSKGAEPPPLVEATDDAVFALYDKKGTTPIWSGKLDEGDRYGFRRGADGKIVGYAEDAGEIPLPEGFTTRGFMWSMQEE